MDYSPELITAVKAEYVTRGLSLTALARQYSLDEETLRAVAQQQGWAQERERHWQGIYQDILHSSRVNAVRLITQGVGAAAKLVLWADSQMATGDDRRTVSVNAPLRDVIAALRIGLEYLKYTTASPEDLAASTPLEAPAADEAVERLRQALVRAEET